VALLLFAIGEWWFKTNIKKLKIYNQHDQMPLQYKKQNLPMVLYPYRVGIYVYKLISYKHIVNSKKSSYVGQTLWTLGNDSTITKW
jgi:hypothetical protein